MGQKRAVCHPKLFVLQHRRVVQLMCMRYPSQGWTSSTRSAVGNKNGQRTVEGPYPEVLFFRRAPVLGLCYNACSNNGQLKKFNIYYLGSAPSQLQGRVCPQAVKSQPCAKQICTEQVHLHKIPWIVKLLCTK